MTLFDFYTLISSIVPTFHYETELQEYPYIIYGEFATNYIKASSKAYTEKTSVEVAFYSKEEFDPKFEELKTTLLDNGIMFSVATSYNRETKVILNQLEVQLQHEVGGVIG